MTQQEQVQPFNILLDRLPDSWEGYLIRTDYRIGVQISLCLQDEDLTQEERIGVALGLLYGYGVPPIETAIAGLEWYLAGGQPKREDAPGGGSQRWWFDFDHARIMASFYKTFGMRVHRESLHWFEFLAMLDCLDEDSSFSNAIQLRGTNTSEMKGRQRREYERAKKLVMPPRKYTDDEQAAIEAFFGDNGKPAD